MIKFLRYHDFHQIFHIFSTWISLQKQFGEFLGCWFIYGLVIGKISSADYEAIFQIKFRVTCNKVHRKETLVEH